MTITIKNPEMCANCSNWKKNEKCSKTALGYCNDFDYKDCIKKEILQKSMKKKKSKK